jgi:hypothetical protein
MGVVWLMGSAPEDNSSMSLRQPRKSPEALLKFKLLPLTPLRGTDQEEKKETITSGKSL